MTILPELTTRCLQQVEQAAGYLADIGCQAGRREVESQHDADSCLPQTQARVFTQQEYHRAQCGNHRECYRQSITSLPFLFGDAPLVFPAIPRTRAATCGEPSGTVRHICHRRPCRPWPVRRTRTPGRTGSRSVGESALITSLHVQVEPPSGERPMRSTTAPGTIGTGEPCSLPGHPFSIRVGRVARVSGSPFIAPSFCAAGYPDLLPGPRPQRGVRRRGPGAFTVQYCLVKTVSTLLSTFQQRHARPSVGNSRVGRMSFHFSCNPVIFSPWGWQRAARRQFQVLA